MKKNFKLMNKEEEKSIKHLRKRYHYLVYQNIIKIEKKLVN